MPKPRVLILRAPGTNCDEETEFAFQKAGALPERWHIERLTEPPKPLGDFQILCIPGGFSYGDDIAAGRIMANKVRRHLDGCLGDFKDRDKLILGICNGFQVLLKSGALVDNEESCDRPEVTLAWNDSGKFEDRWVRLRTADSPCVFFRNVEVLELPVAHAEGKFVTRDEATLERLGENHQLALHYAAAERPASPTANGTVDYPDNPNGSVGNVAGMCDRSGRICGLMPHPERFVEREQHPRWTRNGRREHTGDGLRIFENAVTYFA